MPGNWDRSAHHPRHQAHHGGQAGDRAAQYFHIDIPQELVDAVEGCKNEAQIKQVGAEWCIQQSKELVQFGVPCLHYYSMGKSESVKKVAAEVF